MNEWQTIAWVFGIIGVCSVIFGYIIQDVKKGFHARVTRCEHVIDDVVRDCHSKKEDFITTKAFDRFEGHLNTKFKSVNDGINHLTVRIDDFIKTNRGEV